MDTVIYSASIFLIPDFRESLRQAHQLLSPGGQIGLTFMDGVVSETGENRFFQVAQAHALGLSLRKAVLLTDLETFLRSLFGVVSLQERLYRLPREQVQAFYSIPAMSAGIFPALDYEERLVRIAALFDHLRRRSCFSGGSCSSGRIPNGVRGWPGAILALPAQQAALRVTPPEGAIPVRRRRMHANLPSGLAGRKGSPALSPLSDPISADRVNVTNDDTPSAPRKMRPLVPIPVSHTGQDRPVIDETPFVRLEEAASSAFFSSCRAAPRRADEAVLRGAGLWPKDG